jgi:hypothetical protein
MHEVSSRVLTSKHLTDDFPCHNGLKLGVALYSLTFKFSSEYAIMKSPREWGGDGNECWLCSFVEAEYIHHKE